MAEVQGAHDLYTQELSEEQVETEEKYIEEIEVRFEVIERETLITLRKFGQKFPPAVTAKITGTVPKNEGSVVTGGQSSSLAVTIHQSHQPIWRYHIQALTNLQLKP